MLAAPMISLDTLNLLRRGVETPLPVLAFTMEAPPEVFDFEIEIGGERRRIAFTSPPHIEHRIVAPIQPGQAAAAAVASYLVSLTRAGVITIHYGDQRVYHGPPDEALAVLIGHPLFVKARRR